MNCKDYLKSYRELQLTIERLENRLAIEESRAEKVTTLLSGMPRGGGESFADDTWAALADTRSAYKEKLAESLQLQRELEEFIASVPGATSRILLQLRYIDCLSWMEVAKRMNYDPRWVRKLHGVALEEARRIYENRSI